MLVQNSPGLQLKAKSNSLTGRSIFHRSEGFEDLPVKFYRVFTMDVQNSFSEFGRLSKFERIIKG